MTPFDKCARIKVSSNNAPVGKKITLSILAWIEVPLFATDGVGGIVYALAHKQTAQSKQINKQETKQNKPDKFQQSASFSAGAESKMYVLALFGVVFGFVGIARAGLAPRAGATCGGDT